MSFKAIFYCRGSSPGKCSILSAGNAAGNCMEKLWDLHAAAERDVRNKLPILTCHIPDKYQSVNKSPCMESITLPLGVLSAAVC